MWKEERLSELWEYVAFEQRGKKSNATKKWQKKDVYELIEGKNGAT